LYGWLHRLVPFFLVKQTQRLFAEPGKKKAQASTVAILSGIIFFGLAFTIYVILFHHYFGSPATVWYALSIPLTSLFAHYYVQLFRRCVDALRTAFFVIRAPSLSERLKQLAAELIREIEAAAAESRQEA
jgi:hypothetical protein